MNPTSLITIVTLILAISLAAERLTEIVKGLIPYLNREQPDPRGEARRRACVQILAVVSGVTTAFLSRPVTETGLKALFCTTADGGPCAPSQAWDSYSAIWGLGLLASGGSALWNSILGYLLKVKDIKTVEAEKKRRNISRGTDTMDDFTLAMTVTVNCIKKVGRNEPIGPDDALFDHGIDAELIDRLINAIANNRTVGLPSLDPPYRIDQDLFDISPDSTTTDVAIVVFDNAELKPVVAKNKKKRRL